VGHLSKDSWNRTPAKYVMVWPKRLVFLPGHLGVVWFPVIDRRNLVLLMTIKIVHNLNIGSAYSFIDKIHICGYNFFNIRVAINCRSIP